MTDPQMRRQTVFGCPVEGKAAPIRECPDQYFSQGLVGRGVVIFPTGNTIYSPVDARVDFSFFTKHAVGLETPEGIEFLIHVGIDTHLLEGKGFQVFIKTGDRVKRGDKLLSFDLEGIQKTGCSLATPMVICNSADWKVDILQTGELRVNEDLLRVY